MSTKKTIAIIGAGPGVSMAIAEKFGSEGFNVALFSRSADKLKSLGDQLSAKGINNKVFIADVLDRPLLEAALREAIEYFGSIDVLEYGPSGKDMNFRPAKEIDVAQEQFYIDFLLHGAIAAIQVVLPDFLKRKEGTILFTTAVSAIYPVSMTASYGIAAGAALNYARLLNQELKGEGIYTGTVMIAAFVVEAGKSTDGVPPGFSIITPQDAANAHWKLYKERNIAETVVGDASLIKSISGL